MSNHHMDDWDHARICTRPGEVRPQAKWITDKLENRARVIEGVRHVGVQVDGRHCWETWPGGKRVVIVTRTGMLLRSNSNPVPMSWRNPSYDPAAPGAIRASMRRTG